MSGTSLDGLDLAYCELVIDKKWEYKILQSATIPYSEKREKILRQAVLLTGVELTSLHHKFGKYIGEECNHFIQKHSLAPDFISSHGHTVFHQPQRGFTLQIGHGADIFAETRIPVVCDFRSQDVAMGGQGAPLVPVGDHFLFNEYEACLNLGGFANISAQVDSKRIAWDICAVNVVLNHFARKLGKAYDDGGNIARTGKLFEPLSIELGTLRFYKQPPPKSLGIEWVYAELMPLLEKYNISPEDILHTYTLHIAEVIGKVIDSLKAAKVLFTGGGVYHHFLMQTIKEKTSSHIHIPDESTIQYKEALIFALLGTLKWRGENNVWKSVTGASEDHSSGIVYGK